MVLEPNIQGPVEWILTCPIMQLKLVVLAGLVCRWMARGGSEGSEGERMLVHPF